MNVKCPQCGKDAENAENPFRPFCSERCKLIDMGNWLSGTYRISRNIANEDQDAEMPPLKDSDNE